MRLAWVTLVLLFISGPAWALEDEVIFGLEPQYALFTVPEGSRHGGAGDVSAWFGINDFIWLAASGGISFYPSALELDRSIQWQAHGGVVASLDVLRTIPFVEAMIGIVGEGSQLDPSLRVGVGADYLINPSWSIGGLVRFRPLTGALGRNILNVGLRVTYRIEL